MVCSYNANMQSPHLAYNSRDNEFFVVWQDGRNANTVDIYGQRLNGAGALVGYTNSVSFEPGAEGKCDIAYDDTDNEYLVVWGDTRSGQNIYGRRLDRTGWPIGVDFPVSTEAASEVGPALAYDHANREYVAVWWELYEATDWDIYGGRVSHTGSALGRLTLSTANEVQSRPELAQDRLNGEFLIVWQDFRAGSYDIYGQRWVSQPAAAPTPTATPTSTQAPPPTGTPTSTQTPPLSLTATPTPTPCQDAFEPDDTPAQAQWMALGDPPQQHNSMPAGDVDYVRLLAKAGWTYRLRTFGLTGRGNDTLMRVYDVDGRTILAENDDDPSNPPASRIEWTYPATGEYFVSVQQVFGAVYGCDVAYRLELSGGLPTITPTPFTVRARVYLPLLMRP
jgi:hypothetical protein